MSKARMTDKFVASVANPTGQRLEIFDEHPNGAGLILRVAARGRKSWATRYRTPDGQQRRFALGDYPALSLAEARKRAAAARLSAHDGADPSGARRRKKAEAKAEPIKTVSDLGEVYFMAVENGEWKPKRKQKRASTIKGERWLWSKHIEPSLGGLRVEEVTGAAVKKILRALVAKGKATTSNRVRALVRQVLNFAISEGRIQINPVTSVPALGEETPRERVLNDSEIVQLWTAIEDPSQLTRETGVRRENGRVYVSEITAIAIKVLLLTLQRRGEVAGMERAELDMNAGVWTIPGSRTKNGRTHVVPLAPQVIELLRRAIEIADEWTEKPSPYVFPSRWKVKVAMTPAAISRAMRDVRMALDMPSLTPHDLRRTGASHMVRERMRISPFIVGRILNHTSETGGAASITLSTYAIYDFTPEKRAALNAWSEQVTALLRAKSPADAG